MILIPFLKLLYYREKVYALKFRSIIDEFIRENNLISEIYKDYFRQLIESKRLLLTDQNFAYVKDPSDFVWYFYQALFTLMVR